MALLKTVHPLRLERFSFNDGVLSAFESDLRDHPFDGTYPWLRRVWDDACDVGIVIRSHHTGREERFYLEREETRDGDTLAWHFLPIDPRKVAVKSVVIFND